MRYVRSRIVGNFSATFVGRGCHGAFPHLGRDPIITAAEAIVNLQQFVSREMDPTDSAVVTVPERQLSLAIGKDGQNARLAAKLSSWRVDVVKPAEGEIFEDRPDQFQEPVASQSSRRDRGDRSQGRHDRYDRGGEGGGGSRRSGHQRDRGSHRHNSSYGYDTDRE